MAVNTNTIVSNVYAQNYTPGSKEKTKVARNTETGEVKIKYCRTYPQCGRNRGRL